MKKTYLNPISSTVLVAVQDVLVTSGAPSADPKDKTPVLGGGLSAPVRTIPILRKI